MNKYKINISRKIKTKCLFISSCKKPQPTKKYRKIGRFRTDHEYLGKSLGGGKMFSQK